MYAIGAKEQIEIRNEVSIDITKTYDCYWITNLGYIDFLLTYKPAAPDTQNKYHFE